MVDFALTPRQEELREIARRFAVEVMIPIAEASDRVPDPEQAFEWSVIRDGSRLGLRTLSVPTEFGGEGANVLTLAIVGEALAKKVRCDQGVIHTAQSSEGSVAQAGAHRIAHQQGARQHRAGCGYAQHHSHVSTPIKGEAANRERNSPGVLRGLSLNIHSVSHPSVVTGGSRPTLH